MIIFTQSTTTAATHVPVEQDPVLSEEGGAGIRRSRRTSEEIRLVFDR